MENANLWCERALSKRGLAQKAIDALDNRYRDALDAYHGGNYWMNEWINDPNIDDLVECSNVDT